MAHETVVADLEPWDETRVVDDWGDEDSDDMATVSLPRQKMEEAEMDITPMIDITFLLLIFFLVASHMDKEAQVVLPKARHGTAVPAKSSVIVTVTEGAGDSVNVYRGDSTDDALRLASDLAQQEQEIVQYIEGGLRDEGKEHVILKAERGVKHREVARVARAVGTALQGYEDVFLYVAVLERQ